MFKIFLEIAMNLYAICLLEIYIGFRILKTVFESSLAHGIFQKQSALIPFLEFLFLFSSCFRKQRPAHVTPVQRIVLNPVLEQSIVENAPSPRATIPQKIKVRSYSHIVLPPYLLSLFLKIKTIMLLAYTNKYKTVGLVYFGLYKRVPFISNV